MTPAPRTGHGTTPPTPRHRLAAVVATLVALALAACSGSAGASGASGDATTPAATSAAPVERTRTTVTDETGREVELDLPVASVASGLGGNQYILELIRAVGDPSRVIAATESQINTPGWAGYWDDFAFYDEESPVFVAGETGSFNYDRLIELKPDVLLTGSNSPWQEAEAKLEPFGIKVLVFTAWEPRFSDHNIALLGELFGTQDRAERYTASLTGEIEALLAERLAGLKEEDKVRVYFEGQKDYVAGIPGGWDWVIRYAGGANIYSDIVINGGLGWNQIDVDPADIVSRDPEFIIKNGVADKPQGLYEPWTRAEFEATAQALVSRPGFEHVDAVKNGRVWVTNNYLVSAASKWVGALYLATWLYPERFEGVDPEQYFRAWVEEYQSSQYHPAEDYVHHAGAER